LRQLALKALKPSAGQAPAPSQFSATSQPPRLSGRHTVVPGSLFTKQVPVPLQVSGLSHTVSLGSPQGVPAGSFASAEQAPAPSQKSSTSQSPVSARQLVVLGSLLAKQFPAPSQVSGLSHTVSAALPQETPEPFGV
jgi:hypothetical protein